jgi:hypothetical protein
MITGAKVYIFPERIKFFRGSVEKNKDLLIYSKI